MYSNIFLLSQDKDCDLKINYYVDDVMRRLCELLDVVIPEWSRPHVVLEPLSTCTPAIKFPEICVDEELIVKTENGLKRCASPETKHPPTKKVFGEFENDEKPVLMKSNGTGDRAFNIKTEVV